MILCVQLLSLLINTLLRQIIILILFEVKVRSMRKKEQLRYETEQIEMTTTTLESMFNNLGEKVKNMNLKIQFAHQRQKQAFLMSEERIKEQDDAVSLISEDSDEREPNVSDRQKNANTLIRPKDKKYKGIVTQTRVIEVPFERSILLKEKYSSKLQKIQRRLSVQFIIVPNKVKIYGMKSDLLDQAFVEFGVIQDQINLVPISDYGKQVYQSKYFKELLRENKVQIIKILDKYYFWFQEGIPNPKDLIKEIFVNTTHRLFYFGNSNRFIRRQKNGKAIKLAHGQFTWLNQKSNIITDLAIRIEATIFQKYVENGLNRLEKRNNRKVELSEDRQSILMHLDTIQQIAIQQSNIRSLYEPFKYVYFVFNKTINLEYLEQFLNTYRSVSIADSFRKQKNEVKSMFFTQRIQNYVVISYFEDVNKIVQTENQQLYLQQHYLMQFLKKIPQELLDFKLVIRCLLDNSQDEGDLKKFVFERDPVERLTYVSCKNQRRKNYELLIALYIQKKIQQKSSKEQIIQKAQMSKSISMDISRPVDQTSIMMNGSMNNSSFSVLNGVNLSNIVSGIQKILPADIVNTSLISAFKFEDYSFCIMQKPEEREKKYSEQFKIIKKKQSTLKNLQLQKALNNASSGKFKIWGLNVPLKFKDISLQNQVQILMAKHPQLQKYNKQVTVFYGGKQAKDSELIYVEDQKLKIQKIDAKSKFKQGYLLKTNLIFLYLQSVENSSTDLPFGKYEALYYVKRLQK